METDGTELQLIKKWEGLRLRAYQDTGGVWTIGYGHTKTAKPGMSITEAEAEALLLEDSAWAFEAVDDLVTVDIGPNQRRALGSFVYNLGTTQFRKSTLLRKLNAGDHEGAGKELLRWVYDNGNYIQGLMNRRKDELSVYLKDL